MSEPLVEHDAGCCCETCLFDLYVFVTRGLKDIGAFLASHAAFESWCNLHGRV